MLLVLLFLGGFVVGFFLTGKFDLNHMLIPVVDRPCLALVRQCRKKKIETLRIEGLQLRFIFFLSLMPDKFPTDQWIEAVRWHGDTKIAAIVHTAAEWEDAKTLLARLENVVVEAESKQGAVVWSSAQNNPPAIPTDSFPLQLTVLTGNEFLVIFSLPGIKEGFELVDREFATKVARKDGRKSKLAVAWKVEVLAVIDARGTGEKPCSNGIRDVSP